jgi:hypothetical protein
MSNMFRPRAEGKSQGHALDDVLKPLLDEIAKYEYRVVFRQQTQDTGPATRFADRIAHTPLS